MTTRFRCKDTFRIAGREMLFVRGDVLEGEVVPGMQALLEISPSLFVVSRIAAIEFVDGPVHESHLALGIGAEEPGDLEFWEEYDLSGETLQIVTPTAG